jgi:hypothetical protein
MQNNDGVTVGFSRLEQPATQYDPVASSHLHGKSGKIRRDRPSWRMDSALA